MKADLQDRVEAMRQTFDVSAWGCVAAVLVWQCWGVIAGHALAHFLVPDNAGEGPPWAFGLAWGGINLVVGSTMAYYLAGVAWHGAAEAAGRLASSLVTQGWPLAWLRLLAALAAAWALAIMIIDYPFPTPIGSRWTTVAMASAFVVLTFFAGRGNQTPKDDAFSVVPHPIELLLALFAFVLIGGAMFVLGILLEGGRYFYYAGLLGSTLAGTGLTIPLLYPDARRATAQ